MLLWIPDKRVKKRRRTRPLYDRDEVFFRIMIGLTVIILLLAVILALIALGMEAIGENIPTEIEGFLGDT